MGGAAKSRRTSIGIAADILAEHIFNLAVSIADFPVSLPHAFAGAAEIVLSRSNVLAICQLGINTLIANATAEGSVELRKLHFYSATFLRSLNFHLELTPRATADSLKALRLLFQTKELIDLEKFLERFVIPGLRVIVCYQIIRQHRSLVLVPLFVHGNEGFE